MPEICIHEAEALYEQILDDGFVPLTQCDSLAVLNKLLEGIMSVLHEQCRTARLGVEN